MDNEKAVEMPATRCPRLIKEVAKTNSFFCLGFLSRTFTIHGPAGEGEAISLNLLSFFHPLHRHLDNSQAITAESSPLHIASAGLEPEFPSASHLPLSYTPLMEVQLTSLLSV